MRKTAVIFGLLDLAFAAGFVWLFFSVMPNRHLYFDAATGGICALLALGGLGMIAGTPAGLKLGAVGAGATLAGGLAAIWGVLASAAYMSGLYGGFGRGASVALTAIALLVFQVVCTLPVIQLWWIRRALRRRAG